MEAETKIEAVDVLDEEGDAHPDWIEPWPSARPFYVTFYPAETGEGVYWRLVDEEFPEDTDLVLGDADEALRVVRATEEKIKPS